MSDQVFQPEILSSPINCDIKIKGLPFDEASNKQVGEMVKDKIQELLTQILASNIHPQVATSTRFTINVRTN